MIAFDHRGHGESETPDGPYAIEDLGGDVVELLDELLIERASYVGISLGGAVGLWLAENAPDRFQRFALLCPAAYPSAGAQMWTDRAAQVRADGHPAIADATLARWFLPEYKGELSPSGSSCSPRVTRGTPPAARRSATWTSARPWATSPRRFCWSLPSGRLDPARDGRPLAAEIPGARLEMIADAAHLVGYSHPEVINSLLLTHLT